MIAQRQQSQIGVLQKPGQTTVFDGSQRMDVRPGLQVPAVHGADRPDQDYVQPGHLLREKLRGATVETVVCCSRIPTRPGRHAPGAPKSASAQPTVELQRPLDHHPARKPGFRSLSPCRAHAPPQLLILQQDDRFPEAAPVNHDRQQAAGNSHGVKNGHRDSRLQAQSQKPVRNVILSGRCKRIETTPKGHAVAVYSPILGDIAAEIAAAGIPVVSKLRRLEFEPDVIHCHNYMDAARAFFRQPTTIGPSTRVGNGAFVSHNVRTGRRCKIGHGSVVNGYVTIGDDVWIGPGATLANSITIGDGAGISLGSAVIGDVAAGQRVTGNVAVDHRRFLRHISRVAGK